MNNIGFGLSNGVYAERFDDGEIYVAVVRVKKDGQNIFFDKEYRKDGYWVDRSFTDDKVSGWRPATDDEIREFMQKMQKSGESSKGRMNESDAGQKITMKQFSEWLGFKPFDVSLAINTVRDSDPDGAKTVLEDMGYDEAAEAVEAIYSVYGSLKAAKEVCKEELGIINENKKKLETFVRTIIKESDEISPSDDKYKDMKRYVTRFGDQVTSWYSYIHPDVGYWPHQVRYSHYVRPDGKNTLFWSLGQSKSHPILNITLDDAIAKYTDPKEQEFTEADLEEYIKRKELEG